MPACVPDRGREKHRHDDDRDRRDAGPHSCPRFIARRYFRGEGRQSLEIEFVEMDERTQKGFLLVRGIRRVQRERFECRVSEGIRPEPGGTSPEARFPAGIRGFIEEAPRALRSEVRLGVVSGLRPLPIVKQASPPLRAGLSKCRRYAPSGRKRNGPHFSPYPCFANHFGGSTGGW